MRRDNFFSSSANLNSSPANATYVFNHTRYYLPMNEPARNNSIHGLLWNKTLTVTSAKSDANGAYLVLSYVFDGSDQGVAENGLEFAKPHPLHLPGYPFLLAVDIGYNLTVRGLSIMHRATNLHSSWPAPFFDSWHPYFLCNVSTTYVIYDPCTKWLHVG